MKPVSLTESESTPQQVAAAMVLRGCNRDPRALGTFPRAKAAAEALGGFDARMVAAGQVSAAVRLRGGLNDRETLRGLSVSECRAREAFDAWIDEFERSAQ